VTLLAAIVRDCWEGKPVVAGVCSGWVGRIVDDGSGGDSVPIESGFNVIGGFKVFAGFSGFGGRT
jgi:sulfite reductase alpha subunit-like flavoprotein